VKPWQLKAAAREAERLAAREALIAAAEARRAALPPIDYAALRAAQDAEEQERERERTPEEIKAAAAAYAAYEAAQKAQPDDIARAEALGQKVPVGHRAEWIAAVIDLGSRPPMHHIESVRVAGMSLKNGCWAENAVQKYDGGGSGYGRHAD